MTEAQLLKILNDRTEYFVDKHLDQFPPNSNEYKLLHIFAYGVWADYLKLEPSLPDSLKLDPHSDAAKKLKSLTLLNCFASEKNCSYQSLLTVLSIDNAIELEDLVVELLGSGLIEGKIDEVNSTVICTRASSRCVPNNQEAIEQIITKIQQMRSRISTALKVPTSA